MVMWSIKSMEMTTLKLLFEMCPKLGPYLVAWGLSTALSSVLMKKIAANCTVTQANQMYVERTGACVLIVCF